MLAAVMVFLVMHMSPELETGLAVGVRTDSDQALADAVAEVRLHGEGVIAQPGDVVDQCELTEAELADGWLFRADVGDVGQVAVVRREIL